MNSISMLAEPILKGSLITSSDEERKNLDKKTKQIFDRLHKRH